MDVPVTSVPARLVTGAVSNLGYSITPHTSGGGCDANFYNKMGVECVNLGTGMYELHTVNEHLVLDEFYRAAEIVLEAVRLNTVNGG